MPRLLSHSTRFLILSFFLSACLTTLSAQPAEDLKEIPVLRKFGFGRASTNCLARETGVIDEQRMKKTSDGKDCSEMNKLFQIDFAKETLLSFKARGDCFVRAAAKVYRSDKEKKYLVRVKKIYGGCRAGGVFQGFLVIEKIPADFKIEFSEFEVDEREGNDDVFPLFNVPAQSKVLPEILETRRFEMKGCIPSYFKDQFVIRNETAYLEAMRSDVSREYCLKNLEKIDFTKHTLVGIDINSGYCGLPAGLQYEATKNPAEKRVVLNISYLDTEGRICRAMSSYDLWLLVPKLPDGYEVKFAVKARED